MIVDCRSVKLSVRRDDGFVDVSPDQFGSDGSGVPFEGILPHGISGQPRDEDGGAANVLLFRHGDEGFALTTSDPRFQGILPNAGLGGTCLASHTNTDGTKRTPYVCLFGKDGAQSEGALRIEIPSPVGTTTITVDPSSGDVAITHAGGARVLLKTTGVELGAEGGEFVALAAPITAWAAGINSALQGLGASAPTLATAAATKVKAT